MHDHNAAERSERNSLLKEVDALDIYALKNRYPSKGIFDSENAHRSLQQLFVQFEAVNLVIENGPLELIEFSKSFNEYLKVYFGTIAFTTDLLQEMAHYSSLEAKLAFCKKG